MIDPIWETILSTSETMADAGSSETIDSTAETIGVMAGSAELLATALMPETTLDTTELTTEMIVGAGAPVTRDPTWDTTWETTLLTSDAMADAGSSDMMDSTADKTGFMPPLGALTISEAMEFTTEIMVGRGASVTIDPTCDTTLSMLETTADAGRSDTTDSTAEIIGASPLLITAPPFERSSETTEFTTEDMVGTGAVMRDSAWEIRLLTSGTVTEDGRSDTMDSTMETIAVTSG